MKAIIEIDDEYAKYYDVENLYAEIYAYGDIRPKETFVSLKPLPKKLKLRIQDQWITEWTNKDSLTSEETTKAILVIDKMPSACDECKFESEMLNCGKPMCVATPHRRERIDDDSTRPSWCPLKPMPEKKEIAEQIVEQINAKFDEIVGETE